MFAWQMAKMLHTSERRGLARFVTMQNHYNLVYREEEREMIPLCRDEGIGLLPWSPLARGFLAGNRRQGDHGDTSRAKTDDYAHKLYYQRQRLRRRRSGRAKSRPSAASRMPRSLSPGCCTSPASPPRSSARPSRTTSPTPSPQLT